MAKFIIVLCAVIACAAAKPGIVAPLAYTAPVAAPFAYAAAPLTYANANLDAAYASSRVDIKQNYNAAVVPAAYAAAPVATPLAYSAPLTYAAAPLAYANAHLDAAYASSRIDVKQNYNAAVVPATYGVSAAVAPLAVYCSSVFAAAPILL